MYNTIRYTKLTLFYILVPFVIAYSLCDQLNLIQMRRNMSNTTVVIVGLLWATACFLFALAAALVIKRTQSGPRF